MILEFIKKWALHAKLDAGEERSCKIVEDALKMFFNQLISEIDIKIQKMIKEYIGDIYG